MRNPSPISANGHYTARYLCRHEFERCASFCFGESLKILCNRGSTNPSTDCTPSIRPAQMTFPYRLPELNHLLTAGRADGVAIPVGYKQSIGRNCTPPSEMSPCRGARANGCAECRIGYALHLDLRASAKPATRILHPDIQHTNSFTKSLRYRRSLSDCSLSHFSAMSG